MSGYIKGPWHTSKNKPRQVCDERGYKVANCPTTTKGGNFDIALGVSMANATLIAAAPELLEELGKMVAFVEKVVHKTDLPVRLFTEAEELCGSASVLIAKARGES